MSVNINADELHERLLTMAKYFHAFCEENNIDYYMLGGTMLGAVRHKGFIPWDDDMDFGIPRSDYDRFIQLFNEKSKPEYELRFYKNAKNSPMHYAKLIDNRTTLIECNYHNYIEGLYIDIFPLDVADKNNISERIRNKRIMIKHSLIINHCSTISEREIINGRGIAKGLLKIIIKKYAQMRNLNKLHNSLEELMTKRKDDNLGYIANYLGAWGEREIVPKSTMGVPVLYQFDDTQLYGPEDYDGYLKSLYGKYMELPPKEKRIFKHSFYYLNLNRPYRKYNNKKAI
ncbi:lipopolysaccharide cholinephosphotransferase [Ruminococcus flavefaciens]|uniref:Lipopolysaccharide cholinephosphotransferase n=1 Tax=Ruminococcus flavefaciens TaxID=1265 RepID=A0A1H6JQP2_RUMFL|nr:LicD family protein [Ruminococcus flavefaciens]SEH64783.1 lipopolysaccharide cholinephosphotransferase [Ruminococcus flavefaciens]